MRGGVKYVCVCVGVFCSGSLFGIPSQMCPLCCMPSMPPPMHNSLTCQWYEAVSAPQMLYDVVYTSLFVGCCGYNCALHNLTHPLLEYILLSLPLVHPPLSHRHPPFPHSHPPLSLVNQACLPTHTLPTHHLHTMCAQQTPPLLPHHHHPLYTPPPLPPLA